MNERNFEKAFDEIVAGQKAIMEACQETVSGKNVYFVIGATVAMAEQAKALQQHILKSIPHPFKSMAVIELAKELYKDAVSMEIMSYKKETEDENND